MVLEKLTALRSKSVEFPRISLATLVTVECDLLDDSGVDRFLDVLVDGGIADAGVEFLKFAHRGQLFWVLEDVVDERESCLLGNEVDEFAGFHFLGNPQIGARTS